MPARSEVVLLEAGGCQGTGFLVAPGRLVTALHVVAQFNGDRAVVDNVGVPVSLGRVVCTYYSEARGTWSETTSFDPSKDPYSAYEDWAILEVRVAEGVRVWKPYFARKSDVGQQCRAFGFPVSHGQDGTPFLGQLSGVGDPRSVWTTASVTPCSVPVHRAVFQEAIGWAGLTPSGFSGGPVVVGDGAVGIVRRYMAVGSDGAALGGTVEFTAIEAIRTYVQTSSAVAHTALWADDDRLAFRLLRPRVRRRTGTLERPPSELLLAHNEVVPFDDSLRPRELALLEEFSQDDGPSMLVLTGRGGAGKTRLMLEWCARMRERGWTAGFIESDLPEVAQVTKGTIPRVLVLDYPEGRVREVVSLCWRTSTAAASVRLVLLARSRGPWFNELRQEADSDLVTAAAWHELEPLNEEQGRRTSRSARAAFAGEHGEPAEAGPQFAHDDLPLVAHMRALLRAIQDTQAVERPEQVLIRVLEHERKFWKRHLEPLLGAAPGETLLWELERVLAALVLLGGVDGPPGKLIRWLCPQLDTKQEKAFGACIQRLYQHGERIMALQPDVLGEQLVSRRYRVRPRTMATRASSGGFGYRETSKHHRGVWATCWRC